VHQFIMVMSHPCEVSRPNPDLRAGRTPPPSCEQFKRPLFNQERRRATHPSCHIYETSKREVLRAVAGGGCIGTYNSLTLAMTHKSLGSLTSYWETRHVDLFDS